MAQAVQIEETIKTFTPTRPNLATIIDVTKETLAAAEEAEIAKKQEVLAAAKALGIELGDAKLYSADEIEILIMKEIKRRRRLTATQTRLDERFEKINERFADKPITIATEQSPAAIVDMKTLVTQSREKLHGEAIETKEPAKVIDTNNVRASAPTPAQPSNQGLVQAKLEMIKDPYMRAAAARVLRENTAAEVEQHQESTAKIVEINGKEGTAKVNQSVTRVNGEVVGEIVENVEMVFAAEGIDAEIGNPRLANQEGEAEDGSIYHVTAIGTALDTDTGKNVSVRSQKTFVNYGEAYQWGLDNAYANAEKAVSQLAAGHFSSSSAEDTATTPSLPPSSLAGMAANERAA